MQSWTCPPPRLRSAQGTHQEGERVSWGRRALRRQEVASRLPGYFVTLPQRGHKEGKGPSAGGRDVPGGPGVVTSPSWWVHIQPVPSWFSLLLPLPPLLTLGGNGPAGRIRLPGPSRRV